MWFTPFYKQCWPCKIKKNNLYGYGRFIFPGWRTVISWFLKTIPFSAGNTRSVTWGRTFIIIVQDVYIIRITADYGWKPILEIYMGINIFNQYSLKLSSVIKQIKLSHLIYVILNSLLSISSSIYIISF